VGVPWAPQPSLHPDARPPGAAFDQVVAALDPVLTSMGFAAGQLGHDNERGQVTFCRGDERSSDGGCIDLVLDLEAAPAWRVVDVRYCGYPSERWHLPLRRGDNLAVQLAELRRTLPRDLD
jgi:hypothetical protein